MLHVFPDYYKDFQCIAGACKHNCCIGWEIDIDPDTAAFYQTVPGEMGRRLRANIAQEGEPHFLLGQDERCPFLNNRNLCDIILTLGEEHICGICTDHPRFRNELPGRLETGLGLCCEEAARLMLSKQTPMVLQLSGQEEDPDEITALRDEVLTLLQDRKLDIPTRVSNMLQRCGAALPERSLEQWAEDLLELERLDENWTQVLTALRDKCSGADWSGFDRYMAQRQTEYEQLLVYFVYRHLANAFDADSLAAKAGFAALGYTLLHAIGAVTWTETGRFSFEQQVELARLFSSEIEYSQENLDAILDELSFF